MKVSKFIIPVGISLAAFIWGYRGEIWLGKVDPNASVIQPPATERLETNIKNIEKPAEAAPSSASRPMPTPFTAPVAAPGRTPLKARELPLSSTPDADEYAPEDEGHQSDDDVEDVSGDPEEDQADDQAFPEDEPGADQSENEEVDSDANEGDLEGDETADTADKPVKP